MIQFILGVMLGTLLGFLLMGMCVAAGTADKMSEEYFWKMVEEEADALDRRGEA